MYHRVSIVKQVSEQDPRRYLSRTCTCSRNFWGRSFTNLMLSCYKCRFSPKTIGWGVRTCTLPLACQSKIIPMKILVLTDLQKPYALKVSLYITMILLWYPKTWNILISFLESIFQSSRFHLCPSLQQQVDHLQAPKRTCLAKRTSLLTKQMENKLWQALINWCSTSQASRPVSIKCTVYVEMFTRRKFLPISPPVPLAKILSC